MLTKADSSQEILERFKIALIRFCELAEREGISIRPFDGDGPGHYAQLTPEVQASTLANFQRYVSVCDQVVRNQESLLHHQQFLWRMFQKLDVRPCSTLMDNIQDGDVVEIYTDSYVQIFRSLSFFSICSYTLDDLLCRPFWELFRRDPELFGRLVATTKRILEGTIPGIHWWQVEDHSVDEIDSRTLYQATVRYRLVSPLYDSKGNVSAFVNVFRVLSCHSNRPGPFVPQHREELAL